MMDQRDLLSGIEEAYVQEAADFLSAAPAQDNPEKFIPVRKKKTSVRVLGGVLACAACAALVFGVADLSRTLRKGTAEPLQAADQPGAVPGNVPENESEAPAAEPDYSDEVYIDEIGTQNGDPGEALVWEGLPRMEIYTDTLQLSGKYLASVELESDRLYVMDTDGKLGCMDAILNAANPWNQPDYCIFNEQVCLKFTDGTILMIQPDALGHSFFLCNGACYFWGTSSRVPGEVTIWQLLGAEPHYSVEHYDDDGRLVRKVDFEGSRELGEKQYEYENGLLTRTRYLTSDGEITCAERYFYSGDGSTLPLCTEFYTAESGPAYDEEELVLSHTEYYTYDENGLVSSIKTVEAPTERDTAGAAYADELYDGFGFEHFICTEAGTYDFTPVNSDGVEWEIYVLDEEFADAERYIPQAYGCVLVGEGSLAVRAGNWIYVHCSCNSFTAETAAEGCALTWKFTPAQE